MLWKVLAPDEEGMWCDLDLLFKLFFTRVVKNCLDDANDVGLIVTVMCSYVVVICLFISYALKEKMKTD